MNDKYPLKAHKEQLMQQMPSADPRLRQPYEFTNPLIKNLVSTIEHDSQLNDILNSNPNKIIIQYIQNIKKRPLFIGFDGGSSAGKTCFVKNLLRQLEDLQIPHHLLKMDYYVIAREKRMPPSENYFDMKRWFKLDEIVGDLKKIRDGKRTLYVPTYDFNTGREGRKKRHSIQKEDVVLVEGIFSLDKRIRGCLDINVIIQADPVIRLRRELERNGCVRNESYDFIMDRFIFASNPSYQKHYLKVNEHADIIVDNNDYDNPRIVFLREEIKDWLGCKQWVAVRS